MHHFFSGASRLFTKSQIVWRLAILSFALLSALTLGLTAPASQAHAALPAPQVTSASVYLMDARSGELLYGKNIHERRAIASTTKIMTGLLTIEAGDPQKVVPITKRATEAGGSSLYGKVGQTFTRDQLLWALMLRSANDGAVALAESIGGSVEGFSSMMNKRALELGARESNFHNPNGMPDPLHYSTANDMALISREAMKNPKFREIVRTQNYAITGPDGKDIALTNHNRLLKKYAYTSGIKTGFTNLARHCLVSSASKDGVDLILVVLGGSSAEKVYQESAALFEYGFSLYRPRVLVEEDKVLGRLEIEDVDSKLPLVAADSFESVMPDPLSHRVILAPSGSIEPPIAKGQVVGKALIMVGDEKIGEVPLEASKRVEAPSLMQKATKGSQGFLSGVLSWIAGIF